MEPIKARFGDKGIHPSGVVTEAYIRDARTPYSLTAEHFLGSLFRRAAWMSESRSSVPNWRASLTRAWM